MVAEIWTGAREGALWLQSPLATTDVDPASSSPVRLARVAITSRCPGRGKDLCRRLWRQRLWSVADLVTKAGPGEATQILSGEALPPQLGAPVRARRVPVLLAATLLSAPRELPQPPNLTTNGAPTCDPMPPRPSPQSRLAPEARHHPPQLWLQLPWLPPLVVDPSSTSRSALWLRPQVSRLRPWVAATLRPAPSALPGLLILLPVRGRSPRSMSRRSRRRRKPMRRPRRSAGWLRRQLRRKPLRRLRPQPRLPSQMAMPKRQTRPPLRRLPQRLPRLPSL